MKKILVVFFEGEITQLNINDAFFDIPKRTRDRYLDLFSRFQEKNVEIFVCRGRSSYLGNKKFSHGYRYNKLLESVEDSNSEEINADFIFDKLCGFSKHSLNQEQFVTICKDKFLSYTLLKSYSAQTYLIEDKYEKEEFIKSFYQGKKMILKPQFGTMGRGIKIANDASAIMIYENYPFIIQDFLDTSVGLKGICDGVHDFRCIIGNGDIIYAGYRRPKPGTQICNVSLGGSMHHVDLVNIPKNIINLVKEIDFYFHEYHSRFYSIDLCNTSEGMKLIELNSSPAFASRQDGGAILGDFLYSYLLRELQ